MNTAVCPSTVRNPSSPFRRVLNASLEVLLAFRQAWRDRGQRRQRVRALDAMADMNPALLCDIGAPAWVLAQASARRDLERQRMLELYQGPRHRD